MTRFADASIEIANSAVISNWQSFRAEALYQRVCQMCGRGGDFNAHHVVYEQVLARYGFRKPERYDPRNALRLCVSIDHTDCHYNHHRRIDVIPTARLRDENIVYAFIVLGPFAADWLRRYYDDTEPDPRIQELESQHDHPALHAARGRSARRRADHAA